MVLCTRRSTRCGVVFLLSHDLSQVGRRLLWSRSWQTLWPDPGRCAASATGARAESCLEANGGCASATDLGGNRGASCWWGRLQRSCRRQATARVDVLRLSRSWMFWYHRSGSRLLKWLRCFCRSSDRKCVFFFWQRVGRELWAARSTRVAPPPTPTREGCFGMFVYHTREHTTIIPASLPLCRSQNESCDAQSGTRRARVRAQRHQRARACPRQSRRFRLLLHILHRFHRLHSEYGQLINATAINAFPVLKDVHVGTTQEWCLRLNVPQHGKTHQVLTHCKDWQFHSSFLIPRVVPRGRSQWV